MQSQLQGSPGCFPKTLIMKPMWGFWGFSVRFLIASPVLSSTNECLCGVLPPGKTSETSQGLLWACLLLLLAVGDHTYHTCTPPTHHVHTTHTRLHMHAQNIHTPTHPSQTRTHTHTHAHAYLSLGPRDVTQRGDADLRVEQGPVGLASKNTLRRFK